jgi:hypothetical protein
LPDHPVAAKLVGVYLVDLGKVLVTSSPSLFNDIAQAVGGNLVLLCMGWLNVTHNQLPRRLNVNNITFSQPRSSWIAKK